LSSGITGAAAVRCSQESEIERLREELDALKSAPPTLEPAKCPSADLLAPEASAPPEFLRLKVEHARAAVDGARAVLVECKVVRAVLQEKTEALRAAQALAAAQEATIARLQVRMQGATATEQRGLEELGKYQEEVVRLRAAVDDLKDQCRVLRSGRAGDGRENSAAAAAAATVTGISTRAVRLADLLSPDLSPASPSRLGADWAPAAESGVTSPLIRDDGPGRSDEGRQAEIRLAAQSGVTSPGPKPGKCGSSVPSSHAGGVETQQPYHGPAVSPGPKPSLACSQRAPNGPGRRAGDSGYAGATVTTAGAGEPGAALHLTYFTH
jgi:hypothetical protein